VYVEPIELEPGDATSSPVVKAYGLFDHGIIREPRGRTTQFGMISQGKIKLNSGEQVRSQGILGSADLPVALIYESPAVQKKIDQIATIIFGTEIDAAAVKREIETASEDEATAGEARWRGSEKAIIRNLTNIRDLIPWKWGNISNVVADSLQDIVTRTGSMPPDVGILAQREDNGWLTMTGDRQQLTLAMNTLQMDMTEIGRLNLGQPRIAVIGYGLYGKDPDTGEYFVRKWPGTKLRISDTEEYGVFHVRENPYAFAAQRDQAVALGILGSVIKQWFPIKDLLFNDYVAIANTILLEYAGAGDIKVQPKFEASDIVTEIFRYIGIGEALAYRFNPDSMKSIEDRWFMAVALGYMANRFKGTVLPAILYPTGKAYAYKIAADFELFSKPQLPGIGSGSSPYFIMAANDTRTDTPIPVLCRNGETSILHLMSIPTNIKFQTADVMMGEVPKATVDQKATDEVWFRWRVKSDAKMVTLDRFMRTLLQWRFPVWHLIKNKIPERDRSLIFGMNLLASESTTLADGYLVQAGLGIIPWSPVNVILNARYELEIVKTDTADQGTQELRPGGITEPPRVIPPVNKAGEIAKTQEVPLPVVNDAPGTAGSPTKTPVTLAEASPK